MENQNRPSLSTTRFREIVYASDDILSIKKAVHELYSRVPIELNYEICQSIGLNGAEALLDVGCGTGDFLLYLRKQKQNRPKWWKLADSKQEFIFLCLGTNTGTERIWL